MPKKKNMKQGKQMSPVKILFIVLLVLFTISFLSIMSFRCVQSSKSSVSLKMHESHGKKKVLYIFMNGCGYCKKMDPIFAKMKDTKYCVYVKKEQSEVRDVVQELKINGFPTCVFYDKEGKVVDVDVGYSPKAGEKFKKFGESP